MPHSALQTHVAIVRICLGAQSDPLVSDFRGLIGPKSKTLTDTLLYGVSVTFLRGQLLEPSLLWSRSSSAAKGAQAAAFAISADRVDQ